MATLTVTYDDVFGRVLCAATSLSTTATVALFEVSTDQIHWTKVRGGSAVPVVAGSASVFDYEFAPNVPNFYRISAVNTGAPSFVASSTAVNAVNTSVTPTVPAGIAEGDLLVVWAAIRNSGAGTIVTPAGWTVMLAVDNFALLGRRATTSESNPTVTVAGGVTGADVIAQMAAFRNLELTPAATTWQLNPAAQNITYPALAAFESTWATALILGWKQNGAWTSVATVTGATAEIGEPKSSAGSGAGLVWDYQLLATPAAVAAGAFVVTGGASAISYGAAVALQPASYITRTAASITPGMTQVWLKFPSAPYLNRVILLTDWAETERTSRVGFYTIVQKRTAVASTDTHVPRTVTIELFTQDDNELAGVDLVLSLGMVMLLHIPNNVALKSMYAGIGTYHYMRPAHTSHRATFTIPLTEVGQPDLSIVGNNVTWATLITNYSTWSDVINANATWSSVLALSGTPADALVGLT
jgi:hypothetical protein